MVATAVTTAEQLLTMPDDGHRYELVDGALVRMAPADNDCSRVGGNFFTYLNVHVRSRRLGIAFPANAGFKLTVDPDTVLSPDTAFIRAERVPTGADRRGFWQVAPDLVVEVVSPSDRRAAVLGKVERYLDLGVPLVAVVWPATRSVSVHRPGQPVSLLTEHDTFDGGTVLPDFRVAIADLFED